MSVALRAAAFAWLVGGAVWIVKVLLIWENGGANTDEGVVGVAFVVGLLALGLAALSRRLPTPSAQAAAGPAAGA